MASPLLYERLLITSNLRQSCSAVRPSSDLVTWASDAIAKATASEAPREPTELAHAYPTKQLLTALPHGLLWRIVVRRQPLMTLVMPRLGKSQPAWSVVSTLVDELEDRFGQPLASFLPALQPQLPHWQATILHCDQLATAVDYRILSQLEMALAWVWMTSSQIADSLA